MGKDERNAKWPAPALSVARKRLFEASFEASSSESQLTLGDSDLDLVRGDAGQVDFHDISLGRLVKVERRPPLRRIRDRPAPVNQLLERLVQVTL